MMLKYKKIAGRPSLIRSFTGLPENRLKALLPAFAVTIEGDRFSRSRAQQRKPGAGRKPTLSTVEDKLLFILFYFKFYPTQQVLGFFFGLSQGQANYWIHRLTPVINQALGDKMQLPARKSADIETLLAQCPALEFIIDGTERPIRRPKDKARQQKYYSGKKKRHTVKNVVISEKQTKKIIGLSPTYEGKRHDKSIADEQTYLFPEGSRLYQDTGFQGYQPENVEICQPKKKPRGGQLTEAEKQKNRAISSARIGVEQSIGSAKIYRIARETYRNYKPGYEDTVIETTVGLHNFRIDGRMAA